jgi:two-component system phosphate regulon response regulator OmpR
MRNYDFIRGPNVFHLFRLHGEQSGGARFVSFVSDGAETRRFAGRRIYYRQAQRACPERRRLRPFSALIRGSYAMPLIEQAFADDDADQARPGIGPRGAAVAVRCAIRADSRSGVRRDEDGKSGSGGLVSPRATILIVDDEPSVREVLEEYLVSHGYAAICAENASVAKTLVAAKHVDLALVDIHMPGEDGLSLARHLRERYAKTAVVMLTSAATVVDRIVGLEMGADDYIPKPFDPRELLARVKSVLRRTSSANRAELGNAKVRIGRCVLDLAGHRLVDEQGQELAMSPLEFDLLKAFAEHPNQPLSRERILNLNQRDWDPFDRSVDLRIMRLRKKIEPDPEHPRFIRTIRNAGYIFVPEGA